MLDFIVGNNYVIPDTTNPLNENMIGRSLELNYIDTKNNLYRFYNDIASMPMYFTKAQLLTSNKLESNYGTATPIPKPKD